MAKNDVAVLDFGSGKLTLLVGHRAVNGNFIVSASSDLDYAGFMEGEFIDEEGLFDSVRDSIGNIKNAIESSISKLYVGVPAEFCEFTNETISKNYGKRVRITKKMIDELFSDADGYVNSNTHSVINVSPMYYVLDGDNEIFNPEDCICRTIDAVTSFISADDRFLSLVGRILKDLKISDVEYISSILAEGQYLFSDEERQNGVLMVDSGFLTTTVAYLKGEGISKIANVPLGGAHITASIAETLKLSFDVAEQVKRQLLLSIKPTGIDTYEIYRRGKLDKVSAITARECALRKIDEIMLEIRNSIDAFEDVKEDETLHLTGGGLSYLKAIDYYMWNMLDRRVKKAKPKPFRFSKFDLSSVIALLDASIKMEG